MGGSAGGDKYRSYILGEGEKDTQWKFGAPPNYDVVNKLFEEGRTKEWPVGSLEEVVQRLVKTFEMELVHKVRPQDWKSINKDKFKFSLNGRKSMSPQEIHEAGGSYNFFLQTSLPEKFRIYDPAKETVDSANTAFVTTFPRGFAFEILEVYSGPPKFVFKFRHWAFMDGPFQGHAPTGEKVEFHGVGIFEVDEDMRIEKAEVHYERGELLTGLLKGASMENSEASIKCPFLESA